LSGFVLLCPICVSVRSASSWSAPIATHSTHGICLLHQHSNRHLALSYSAHALLMHTILCLNDTIPPSVTWC
jgi:hypothetical protein